MDLGLAGKVAMVTGATRGIGLSIAEHLLDEGAEVAICARSEGRVTEPVTRLSERSPGRVIDRSVEHDVMGTVRSVEAALPFLQESEAGAITITTRRPPSRGSAARPPTPPSRLPC